MRTEKQKEQSRASARRWYYAHKKLAHEASRNWAKNHPEKRKEIARNWAKSNLEKTRPVRQKWHQKNRIKIRDQKRIRVGFRKQTDINFKILELQRTRLWKALKGISKSRATKILLGCSLDRLRRHLENQFRSGMAWKNYGPVWHVDHIRPCASFDLTDPEQQKQCFHYSNLQPLFAGENLRKGSNVQGR